MSIWTQVTGSIRFDSLYFEEDDRKKYTNRIRKAFGKPATWEKWEDDCIIPCGSEGSLTYEVLGVDNDSCTQNTSMLINGSLRSYDETDIHEIKEWLDKACSGFCVRQGILDIRTGSPIGGYPVSKVLIYEDEAWHWK